MNFEAILREIDAEIERLVLARELLREYCEPTLQPRKYSKKNPRRQRNKPSIEVAQPIAVEVPITIVPPKQKREYYHRAKVRSRTSEVLGSPVVSAPVFVPRTVVVAPSIPLRQNNINIDTSKLEAAVRKSFLG